MKTRILLALLITIGAAALYGYFPKRPSTENPGAGHRAVLPEVVRQAPTPEADGGEMALVLDEREVQAYLNMGLDGGQVEDVQAYTGEDVMEAPVQTGKKRKTRYYKVRHHKPRPSSLGFSITPPPGRNWYEKLEDDSLIYVKINKQHRRYVILTEAREVNLDRKLEAPEEVISYVRAEKQKLLASPDYEKPDIAVQPQQTPADRCVRYRQYYRDYGMKGLRGNGYVNVDTHGLFCLHPSREKVAIDMSYVEKSMPNTTARSYSKEGEQFLASLRFQ